METQHPFFFCAIGGSGMLPLALLLRAAGYEVRGSDRAFDQGRTPERFAFLQSRGIRLFPQNGSGVTPDIEKFVVSTAVEATVPDYAAAIQLGLPIVHRAVLLTELFNRSKIRIAVAGTSGKSTTTGMIGWILHFLKRSPTIVNGAVMKNFVTPAFPFASCVPGDETFFVAETDESDGSIENFRPSIAVLNNVALDHKSLPELRALFGSFIGKAKTVVVNFDNAEAAAVAAAQPREKIIGYSLKNPAADLFADNLSFRAEGCSFDVTWKGKKVAAVLHLPGAHNVMNALAALGAAVAAGCGIAEAVDALGAFSGIARRFDVLGSANGATVIDDFAHNADKIGATLKAMKKFPGRVLAFFQPHGYGPLRLMRKELAACFAENLEPEDKLFLTDPLYLGGTVNKSVTGADLAADIEALGRAVVFDPSREICAGEMVHLAEPGDRIVIMGARDDSLTLFARDILRRLGEKKEAV